MSNPKGNIPSRPNLTSIDTTGKPKTTLITPAPNIVQVQTTSLLKPNIMGGVRKPMTNPSTSATLITPAPNIVQVRTTGLLKPNIMGGVRKPMTNPATSAPLISQAPNIAPVRTAGLLKPKKMGGVRKPMTNPSTSAPLIIDLTGPQIPAARTVSVPPTLNQPVAQFLTPNPGQTSVMGPQNASRKHRRETDLKDKPNPLAKMSRLSSPPHVTTLRSPVPAEAAKVEEPCKPIDFEKMLCENRVREFERSDNALVKLFSSVWLWTAPSKVTTKLPWNVPNKSRIIHGFTDYKKEHKDQYNLTALRSMMAYPGWWVHIEVYNFPEEWKKEDVMNAILDFMPEYSFIPCFIDFGNQKLRFIVGKCKKAFMKLYDNQFVVSVNEHKLLFNVAEFIRPNAQLFDVSQEISNQLDLCYDNRKNLLNLKHFLLAPDISYVFYFPLAHLSNQYTLVNIKSNIPWHNVLHLDLSNNNLRDIDHFSLNTKMPQLQTINLSNNKLHNILSVACCKGMKVRRVWLEGNPLCYDYINQVEYIEVAKTIFPNLSQLDGVSIDWNGTPMVRDNYLVNMEAHNIVEKFLEVYFALIESNDKTMVKNLYAADAMLSVTCGDLGKLEFRRYLMLFQSRSRDIRTLVDPTDFLYIGAKDIASLIGHWPQLQHDPLSFYIDVHFHSATATILTVSGILKIPSATFRDEEPVLEFTRTFVLKSFDNYEHKITNDMMHLTMAAGTRAKKAFQKILLTDTDHGLKFETAPSDEMKEKLIAILVKLIQLPKHEAQKCLEMRNWHLQHAIEYFIILQNRHELHLLTHVI